MTIHIRTEIRTWWSFIKTAVIRIGDDVLEVSGGSADHERNVWSNGVPVVLVQHKENEAQMQKQVFELAGYKVVVRQPTWKQVKVRIELLGGAAVGFEVFKEFVKVVMQEGADKRNGNTNKFGGSVGLMGSHDTIAEEEELVGRDGKTLFTDMNAFGQEWQVREEEPMLFQTVEGTQHPLGCVMPEQVAKEDKRRRLGASMITLEDAEVACAHAGSEADRDVCIFDVLATNDKDMAGSY